MAAVNTHRTLNDYRMSTEPAYESGSLSKFGAGALVIAIFLGIGAYFYYSTPHGSAHANPASGDMNYQAPAATPSNGAVPADTMDQDHAAMPDAPNAAAPAPTAPSTDANTARTSASEPAMNRAATENKSNVAPVQTAQRTKQSTKSPTKSISETTPASTGNAAAASPTVTEPAITSPQPATGDHTTDTTQDPMASKSSAPVDVVPDAADGSFGG